MRIAAKATDDATIRAEAVESCFFVFVIPEAAFLESLERKNVALHVDSN